MTNDREWVVGNFQAIIHTLIYDEILAFANLTGDENPLHVDSDYAERTPVGGQIVHGMSAKSACWGLVRFFAVECGSRGIRCNAISPNMTDIPYMANMSVQAKQVEAASNPLRRLCRPEDVADVAEFLLDSESGYINGVNLPVTGGSKMSS